MHRDSWKTVACTICCAHQTWHCSCHSFEAAVKTLRCTAIEEKHERVQKLLDELKAKHGGQFWPQYRLRAKFIDVNQHDSMENAPLRSMFKKEASSVPWRVSATAIASIVQDVLEAQASHTHTLTPIRAAGLKSNYIQQIKDLHQLLEMRVINDSNFATQKSKILRTMGDICD